jgi:hypothetical protein
LASAFGEDADTSVSELVDLLYLVRPEQIMALERKKISRQEVKNYLKQYLSSSTGENSGSGGNEGLPPFLTITRIVPYESYQKEATIRSHLLDMSLKAYMQVPYETAMQDINSQLVSHNDNKILQHALSETKDYLQKMNNMSERMTKVGN